MNLRLVVYQNGSGTKEVRNAQLLRDGAIDLALQSQLLD